MLEYPPRRSPSGQDTASTSCCASTPSASQGSSTRPSAGSRKPPCPRGRAPAMDDQMTKSGGGRNLGTYWAQRPAYGHLEPPTAARGKISPELSLPSSGVFPLVVA